MKVILYMTITANGYIARENDDVDFATEAEWERFRRIANQIGNMIIGKRTYNLMKKDNEFLGLENVKVIVLTSDTSLQADNPSTIFTNQPPRAILKQLEELGFNEALVAGGGRLNTSFMKENLIDEIYLDVEPIILGKGIKLFSDADFENRLELIEVKNLSNNEVRLHYKVKK